jgi:hypothetical protein
MKQVTHKPHARMEGAGKNAAANRGRIEPAQYISSARGRQWYASSVRNQLAAD